MFSCWRPFGIAAAAVFFWMWPWRLAAVHLGVLGLLGLILADVALYGFKKIPFTCSYLPGKTQVHMVFLAGVGLLLVATAIAPYELRALGDPNGSLWLLLILAAVAAFARWRTAAAARSGDAVLQFEEEMPAVILTLDLRPGNVPPAG